MVSLSLVYTSHVLLLWNPQHDNSIFLVGPVFPKALASFQAEEDVCERRRCVTRNESERRHMYFLSSLVLALKAVFLLDLVKRFINSLYIIRTMKFELQSRGVGCLLGPRLQMLVESVAPRASGPMEIGSEQQRTSVLSVSLTLPSCWTLKWEVMGLWWNNSHFLLSLFHILKENDYLGLLTVT